MDRPRALLPAASHAALVPGLVAAALLLAAPASGQEEETWRSSSAGHAAAVPAADEVAPDPVPPGQAALDRARTAWEKGDYDVAEPLYAEALDKGGLPPADVLDAYVHLGSARAVLGKKAGALAAFKMAALLSPSFSVPSDAGKKALALADQARTASTAGKPAFRAIVPDHTAARRSIPVDVTLDAAHASLSGSKLGVYVRSRSGDPPYADTVRAATSAQFDLPASLSLPSTTLRVRVDWLDARANRLASAEEQVHVQPLLASSALAATAPAAAEDSGKHRGFWHTAWPYVIGSVLLAAGGAAIYFATRTPADVDVTGVQVMPH